MESIKSSSKKHSRKPVELRSAHLRERTNTEGGKTKIAARSSSAQSLSRNVRTKELKENVAPLVAKADQELCLTGLTKKHPPNKR